jgi:AraC-like DNA-binding protein/quercetin dioxygenase-like cupin family protein
MSIGKTAIIKFPELKGFDFRIKHNKIEPKDHTLDIDLHTHIQFEIYLNLSGDVSFLVQNNLYEIKRGDVIISRPGEEHHCVYRSAAPHEMFWILFDCEQNSGILDFLKEEFSDNYLSCPEELQDELFRICYSLNEKAISEEERLYYFFRIFAILKMSKTSSMESAGELDYELKCIIKYINNRICEEISIKEIADTFFISQSSLERSFKRALGITPLEFIKRKKIALAAKLLRDGKSVLNAGLSVGYNDNSHFIKLFKKYYGITPNQYKKRENKV